MKGNTIGWAVLLIAGLSLVGCAAIPSGSARSPKSADNALTTLAGENDPGWSPPVKGLRARLLVLPAKESASQFCRVFIEFQNVDEVEGQKRIRFAPEKLTLRVTDQNDQGLPAANGSYDGVSPVWETIPLPYSGMIRFQISFPGHGYGPADKIIVDVGPSKVWVIPQDGSTYYLSGRLFIEPKETDHPSMDWNGTLVLPKTEIPQKSAAH